MNIHIYIDANRVQIQKSTKGSQRRNPPLQLPSVVITHSLSPVNWAEPSPASAHIWSSLCYCAWSSLGLGLSVQRYAALHTHIIHVNVQKLCGDRGRGSSRGRDSGRSSDSNSGSSWSHSYGHESTTQTAVAAPSLLPTVKQLTQQPCKHTHTHTHTNSHLNMQFALLISVCSHALLLALSWAPLLCRAEKCWCRPRICSLPLPLALPLSLQAALPA